MRRFVVLLALSLVASASVGATFLTNDITTIQQIRGREFVREVTRKTILRETLRETLRMQMEKGLTLPPADYVLSLRALHLLGDQEQPLERLLDLYEAQVLAFYDPAEHVYYAIDKPPAAAGDVASLLHSAISVHELTHALQDQVFDAGTKLESLRNDWDRQLAYHAVLEGEATLVMLAAMFQPVGKSIDDLIQDDSLMNAMTMSGAMSAGIPPEAPPYFVSAMKFPYVDGLRFVIAAYRKGGWGAIDRLHESPPMSTEQILHPELYDSDLPPAAATRSVEEPNGDALVHGSLGEFHWRYLLGNKAAAGWGGDKVEVFQDRKKRTTVIAATKWDSEEDAEEFAEAYKKLLAKKGEKPRFAVDGVDVVVGYGVDRKLIERRVNHRASR